MCEYHERMAEIGGKDDYLANLRTCKLLIATWTNRNIKINNVNATKLTIQHWLCVKAILKINFSLLRRNSTLGYVLKTNLPHPPTCPVFPYPDNNQ